MQDLVGTTLGGQYKIEIKVGQGGMAEVYRAYQLSLSRHVAIKVLPPSFADQDPDFFRRFEREARAVAQLNHPNILPVYDFGVDQKYSYIVMRYVEGSHTLAQLMRHRLSAERAIHLISQVADAISYAHDRGIIHRDVKPSNILLDNDWALLSDFGLAKFNQDLSRLTQTGRGIGTAAYMSPEQSQGVDIDHRTDIYSLGVILYQMLTGEIPHDAENPVTIMMQRISNPPRSPREINSEITEHVEKIILRALSTERDFRYDSASDFASVLRMAGGNGAYHRHHDDSQKFQTTVFSTNAVPELEVATRAFISEEVEASPLKEVGGQPRTPQPSRNIWKILPFNRFLTVVSAIIGVVAVVWLWSFFGEQSERSRGEVAGFAVIERTPTFTPTITNTPRPTSTSTATPRPTNTVGIGILPTLKPTDTPTPAPPTATPTNTATFTPVPDTPTPTATNTPRPTPTATARQLLQTTPPTSGQVKNTFVLEPFGPDQVTSGPIIFEWQWTSPLEENQGFEIRVWRTGEPPLGAHDAVNDNREGQIKALNNNVYQLALDISDAAGIRGRSGEYFWTVVLIEVSPDYVDLGVQATPGQLRFESASGGGDDDGGGGVGFE